MFSKFFIERPIFATVLALLFVVAGLVTLNILPVAQYPDITPPTVQVSAVYPGANAETVAQTVGIPIEQQVNGVDGMLYMSSNSSASIKRGISNSPSQALFQWEALGNIGWKLYSYSFLKPLPTLLQCGFRPCT